MLMKKFQELRKPGLLSVPAFYGQVSHRSNPNPSIVPTSILPALGEPQTLQRTSPARQSTPALVLERPNVYQCPYPCRISTDALDWFRCMPFRRVDWSGSCAPSTDTVCKLPRAYHGDYTAARSSLLHGSDNRGTVGDTSHDQCRRCRDPVLRSVVRGFPSEE
jgi:hypothetical protein